MARSPLRDVSQELAHCSTSRRHELLGQTRFFGELDAGGLEHVNSRFRETHYSRGEWIWDEGGEADQMYVVAAGQVKLVRTGADGRETVLDLAGSGDLIGADAAFGNARHEDGAQAHTDCCLLRVSSDDFRQLLSDQPQIALQVLAYAGEQLTDARGAIRGLSNDTVSQRLASTLLKLAQKHGEEQDGATIIQTPLRQQDLADMLGTTVESVNRGLTAMRDAGLISTGRGWVVLLDPDGLRTMSTT